MMRHLKIEIEPWLYPNSPSYELRVKLYFDGQEFGYQEVVPPDFLQSQFDQIWDYAGRKIKESITGK